MNNLETADRIAFSSRANHGPIRFSLRDGRYKFIATVAPGNNQQDSFPALPSNQLYDLTKDPSEKNNLVRKKTKLAITFSKVIQRHLDILTGKLEDPPPPQISDKALLERLRSLGYIE